MMTRLLSLIACTTLSLLEGCMVGPNYERPAAVTAPIFKEAPAEPAPVSAGWKPGQPSDQAEKGDWSMPWKAKLTMRTRR
jgi:hypothetical protein